MAAQRHVADRAGVGFGQGVQRQLRLSRALFQPVRERVDTPALVIEHDAPAAAHGVDAIQAQPDEQRAERQFTLRFAGLDAPVEFAFGLELQPVRQQRAQAALFQFEAGRREHTAALASNSVQRRSAGAVDRRAARVGVGAAQGLSIGVVCGE